MENRLVVMETRPDLIPPYGQFPLTERRKLEFSYDAQGRRFAKKVSTWNGGGWTLVTHIRFLYDVWNLIAELNAMASNTTVRTYAWGLDLSGSLQGAGGVGGLLFASISAPGSSLHVPCFDGNGNAVGYIDMASGSESVAYKYSAFGETSVADGGAKELVPFRFSTKYTDSETSLLYYGLRYYNPRIGRWPSRDPIEEMGGINLYAFTSNGPLSRYDHLGMLTATSTSDGGLDVSHAGATVHFKSGEENISIPIVTSVFNSPIFAEHIGDYGDAFGRYTISGSISFNVKHVGLSVADCAAFPREPSSYKLYSSVKWVPLPPTLMYTLKLKQGEAASTSLTLSIQDYVITTFYDAEVKTIDKTRIHTACGCLEVSAELSAKGTLQTNNVTPKMIAVAAIVAPELFAVPAAKIPRFAFP